jgi:TANFOR domain-containing protein
MKLILTKLTLFGCLWLLTLKLNAQINIAVQILPPYPTKFTDYASRPQLMIITVTNVSTVRQKVQLRGTVTGDNGITISAKPGYRSSMPIEIEPGQAKSLNGNDLAFFFDYSRLDYVGITQNEFINKGGLPEGSYQLCIRAFNYDNNEPLSAEQPAGCSNFFSISSLEPPVIISPYQEEIVGNGAGQVFVLRWNTPVSTPPSVRYRIKMVEILGNRNPNDAIMTATQPYFFEKEVSGNMYVYNPADPQLTPGRNYALMVEAFDPFGATPFRNQGRSEVVGFTYGQALTTLLPKPQTPVQKPNMPPDHSANGTIALVPDCQDCKETPGTGPSANSDVQVGSIITVNKFKMNVLSVNKEANNLISGEGTIALPFLNSNLPGAKLRVTFTNLDVNAQLKMKSGSVEGVLTGDGASLFPKIDGPQTPTFPLGVAEAKNLSNYFSSHAEQMASAVKNSANAAGFELPLGIQTDVATVAIARVYFDASQAWFEAAAVMDIPDGGPNAVLALSGRNICLNPENLCKSGVLYLSENFEFAPLHLQLNKPGDPLVGGPGTYITFDKDGFKNITIDATYTFPSETILAAKTQTPLQANLVVKDAASWSDWIAELTLPAFYITGMQAIKFDLGSEKIYYDHSDFRTPTGIPAEFTSPDPNDQPIRTGELTWKGFYIPKIGVVLPEIIQHSSTNTPVQIIGSNLVIDGDGFTGQIKNEGKVLEIGDGSMDGWYASIDNVNLSFFKSGFKTSSMNGKLVLPGSKDQNSVENQLDYNATLTTTQSDQGAIAYNFTIANKNGIAFDALFTTLSLNNQSEFVIKGSTNQPFTATANLSGTLSLSNDPLSKIKVPGIGQLHFPEVTFNNLKLMTQSPFIDKNAFTASLASPQKGLAGFKFTAEANGFQITAEDLNSASLGLSFTGGLKLAGEALGCEAKTSFTISSGIKKENNRIKWTGIGGKVNDITLAAGASLGPLTIKGAVKYFNKSVGSQIDEGFVGALESSIASMLTVNMRARFGTKTDHEGDFNYFDFNALADFGQTGITFAPPVPLALYGFGGGVYYNMKITNSIPSAQDIPVKIKEQDVDKLESTAKSEHDPDPNLDAEALLAFNQAKLELAPERGKFGIQATVLFGLTSRNTLDADATLSMEFNANTGGVRNIKLNGNARILTDISKPLSERKNVSTGAGDLVVDINPVDHTFFAGINAELGLPNIQNHNILHVTGGVDFFSGPKGWYLKAGSPADPNKVTVLSLVDGKSYFEVGTLIDDMPDVPQEVYDIIDKGKTQGQDRTLKKPLQVSRVYSPGANKGLIFGANASVGDPNKTYKFLMFYGKLFAMAGFDFAVQPGVSCDGVTNAGGPGGWYAKGQAYLGAKATLGIEVDLFIFSGKIEIFDAGVAATVSAGLPNPTWVKGTVGGYYSILDGAIDGRFNFGFSMGEECVNSNADPFAGLELISQVSPASSLAPPLPITTVPSVVFNLKLGGEYPGTTWQSGYFEFDDFDRMDNQGNPQKRYFLFDNSCVTATLNGIDVSKNLKRFPGDNYALYYSSTDYLTKDKQYTFKVTANMKEGIPDFQSAISGNSPTRWEFITNKNSSQKAEQQKETTFKTNAGFTEVPTTEYALTAPLHSNKAVLTKAYGTTNNEQFLEFRKVINPQTFFIYPEGTTYVARIYKDGVRSGGDLTVNLGTSSKKLNDGAYRPSTNGSGQTINYNDTHSKWSYIGPQLINNSSYQVVIIAKTPSGGNAQTNVQTNLSNYQSGSSFIGGLEVSGVTVNAKVRSINGSVNNLRSDEHIVAGFSFKTSKYETYEAKFEATQLSKLVNIEKMGQTISPDRGKATNHNLFKQWIKWDGSLGKYVIKLGDNLQGFNFPVDVSLSGELFSKADRYETSSNEIFQPETADGSLQPNLQIDKLYHGDAVADYGNDYFKLKKFIADNTGIPIQQLAVVVGASPIKIQDQGEVYTHIIGGGSTYFLNNVSSVGAKLPTALPQSNPSNGFSVNSNLVGNFDLFQLQTPIIVDEIRGTNVSIGSRGQLTFTNPIQKQIDKIKNWAVNPGDNVMSANPGVNLSNAAVWENVSAVTGSYINGGMNANQFNSNIQGALKGSR